MPPVGGCAKFGIAGGCAAEVWAAWPSVSGGGARAPVAEGALYTAALMSI